MLSTTPIFRKFAPPDPSAGLPESPWTEMGSFAGATNKAGVLIVVCVAMVIWAWIRARMLFRGGAGSQGLLLLAFTLLGAIAAALVFLTLRKKAGAPLTAPLYAVFQGLFLGLLAAGAGVQFPGVGIQTVLALAAMSLGLLLAYRLGLLHVNDSFNRKIATALGAAFLFPAANFVLGRMGMPAFSRWGGGVPGIFVLAAIAYLAGICMTGDFDSSVRCTKANISKSMEWYVAFGLVLALIWFVWDAIAVFTFWEASTQGPPGAEPPIPPI